MFDKKTKSYTEHLGKTNRIVEGTTILGDIVSPADFRLDGELYGNFKSNGKIVIGPAGKLIGDISCQNADIEGFFQGRIQVVELLSIKATASIKGEVITTSLSVEPGAEFTATCSMKDIVKNLIPEDGQQKLQQKSL